MGRAQGRISQLRTVGTFLSRGTCSQALLCVLNRAFEHPDAAEERASDPLAGGIAGQGYQCGMIWGATLAAGAEAYRRFGAGARAEAGAVLAARRLVEAFRAQNAAVDCFDLTGLNASASPRQMAKHFLLEGGTVACCRRAARYAPAALGEIGAALAEAPADPPAGHVSCAAVLARRMGAPERHVVMAAGLAGGIGLSGGACGALGAAIWIAGLRALDRGERVGYKSKAAGELVERFLKRSGYEFECSAIVGRRFADVADHARHLEAGGCAAILDALAG